MAHAAGSFSVKSWDESTYQDLGEPSKLTKAAVAFSLVGDLTAEATWDAVMYYRPDGTAVFTGMQHVTGQLSGHEGSFILQADGEYIEGEARSRWQIVDGSGTRGLAGLTGTGSSIATASPPGTFSLDYNLG
jgi:Protein of unknown function (DUF3224)